MHEKRTESGKLDSSGNHNDSNRWTQTKSVWKHFAYNFIRLVYHHF